MRPCRHAAMQACRVAGMRRRREGFGDGCSDAEAADCAFGVRRIHVRTLPSVVKDRNE